MNDKDFFTKVLRLKLPWHIERVELDETRSRVDIWVGHEEGIQVACPECGCFYALYDHLPERVYQHLDTCDLQTYIHVRLPRVECPRHGVKRIDSEFGENGSGMTYGFEKRLIAVAQECSIEGMSRLCGVSWDRGWDVVERSVTRGLERKPHRIPERLGVDEKAFARGHRYETLVYDLDGGTVEHVCDDRRQESLEEYYRQFSLEERTQVKVVTMDMWDPYFAATKAWIPEADGKIVFDRFHVMRYVVDAVDKVRKEESRQLAEEGDGLLKGTKYLWLWNLENIPVHRQPEFQQLRKKDLKVSRAWAIKENLRHFWSYRAEGWMRNFFSKWFGWARRSRLKPIIKAARTLKTHLDNIVTYAKHQATNAIGESLNSKIEKVKRLACGFRNRNHYKTAIYFHCGGLNLLPIPPARPQLRFRIA